MPGDLLQHHADNLATALQGVFSSSSTKGEDDIGMPAYNGGLFDRARAPLLERTNVPDKVMAPIIDALSRRTEDLLRGWINYRDLSVSHLGGIYERLLEYTLVHEVQAKDTSRTSPRSTAWWPARQLCAQGVGQLLHPRRPGAPDPARIGGPAGRASAWTPLKPVSTSGRRRPSLNPADWDVLDKLDPASAILELKICDPAMGSGHFLVALVDDLADRVLEAINAAAQHLVSEQPWAAHLVEAGPALAKPAGGAHCRTSAQHQDRGARARLGRDRRAAGRPPHRAPHDPEENHLRCGQEPHGRRTGQRPRCGCTPSPSARRCPFWTTT
jgi:hypothetical protein